LVFLLQGKPGRCKATPCHETPPFGWVSPQPNGERTEKIRKKRHDQGEERGGRDGMKFFGTWCEPGERRLRLESVRGNKTASKTTNDGMSDVGLGRLSFGGRKKGRARRRSVGEGPFRSSSALVTPGDFWKFLARPGVTSRRPAFSIAARSSNGQDRCPSNSGRGFDSPTGCFRASGGREPPERNNQEEYHGTDSP